MTEDERQNLLGTVVEANGGPVRGCLQVTARTDAASPCAEDSNKGRAGDLSSQARASAARY